MKILVVDDSGTMRHIQRKALGDLGFTDVEEAADGELALKAVGNGKFDLILLDWNMPNMSGIEALKRLKMHPEHHAIPVIMVTSEAEKGHILEAIQAGAVNYLLKPFSPETLKEKVSPYLMKKR